MEAGTSLFTVLLVLLIVVLSVSARAQPPFDGVDGCTILSAVVYTEVRMATQGHIGSAYGNVVSPDRDETSLCTQTACSTTSAFTSALREANVYVTWGIQAGYSGACCVGHALSQCYPTGDPAMPPLSTAHRSLVLRAWQAVYDSVSGHMSSYPGSDVSRFQSGELGRSIRRSLAARRLETVVFDEPQPPGGQR